MRISSPDEPLERLRTREAIAAEKLQSNETALQRRSRRFPERAKELNCRGKWLAATANAIIESRDNKKARPEFLLFSHRTT